MKNKFFNYRLYLDGLKQLKLMGILGAVIMGCAAFFVPLGLNIQNADYIERMQQQSYHVVDYKEFVYDMMYLNPVIFAVILFTAIFTLYLFSFLNSRSASDFYHATPNTRQSLLLSYGASIFTIDFALVAESYIISIISAGIFEYVQIDTAGVMKPFLAVLAGCIFVLGVIIIAMSVTGTTFSNLCVAAMVIAFPRILATFYVYMVTRYNPFVDFTFGGSILDDRLNVVTNFFTGMLIRGRYQAWNMYSSIFYTLAVGVIYCIIGAVLFVNRKSETACTSASNGKLQCVFRLIPAIVVSLFPISEIIKCMDKGYAPDSYMIFQVAVGYVIAVIAYFAYELATTKKLKNILKSSKGLVWLVLFNVVFIVASKAGYTSLMTEIKNPEKITCAQISLSTDTYYYNSVEDDYFADVIENSRITSRDFIMFLAETYNHDIELYKKGQSFYRAPYGYNEVFNEVKVTFQKGIFKKTRTLYLTGEQESMFIDYIGQMPELTEKLVEFADINDVERLNVCGNAIDDDNKAEVLRTFKSELLTKDIGDVLKCEMLWKYTGNSAVSFLTFITDNGKYVTIDMADDFPKTKKIAFESVNKQCDEQPLKKFLDAYDFYSKNSLQDLSGDDYISGNFTITLYEDGYKTLRDVYYSGYFECYNENDNTVNEGEKCNIQNDFTDNGYKLLREIDKGLKESDSIDVTKPYVEVIYSYSISKNGEYSYEAYNKYYNIDEATLDILKDYR